MKPGNEEGYAERLARLDADAEYDRLLTEQREQITAARRDGTPEPPSFRRKDGEVVYSKKTTTEVRLRAAQRAATAAEMKAHRYSWETIAQTLGYKNAAVARKSVERYIDRLPQESMELLRAQELADLDHAEATLADRIGQGDVQAIESMLKIKHHRARITGLYDRTLSAAGTEIELVVVQTTHEVARIVKADPDMPVEQIIAAISTATN
ncbi:hypothetical protein ACTU6U_11145 [Microbacterium sp. A196]